jgi:hypothetical protein
MSLTSLAETDRLDGQRREQGDLAADVVRQLALRAAQDHVGLDADAPQLVDRVLRGFGLELPGVPDVRHEREVDEQAVAAPDVHGELADGLQERQRLDVADGPPISVMTTSTSAVSPMRRIRCLISSVMCGTTCTVPPR